MQFLHTSFKKQTTFLIICLLSSCLLLGVGCQTSRFQRSGKRLLPINQRGQVLPLSKSLSEKKNSTIHAKGYQQQNTIVIEITIKNKGRKPLVVNPKTIRFYAYKNAKKKRALSLRSKASFLDRSQIFFLEADSRLNMQKKSRDYHKKIVLLDQAKNQILFSMQKNYLEKTSLSSGQSITKNFSVKIDSLRKIAKTKKFLLVVPLKSQQKTTYHRLFFKAS